MLFFLTRAYHLIFGAVDHMKFSKETFRAKLPAALIIV